MKPSGWSIETGKGTPRRPSKTLRPILCRVPSYFLPGFPSPTTILIGINYEFAPLTSILSPPKGARDILGDGQLLSFGFLRLRLDSRCARRRFGTRGGGFLFRAGRWSCALGAFLYLAL